MTGRPSASSWLNYHGDVTPMVGEVFGPNVFGEWLTAVEARYDEASNRTRVGFAIGIHQLDAEAPDV